MRRANNEHGRVTEGNPSFQAGVEVGNLYAYIKTQLNAIAAKDGGGSTAVDLAKGLGNLLLAEEIGEVLHDPERLSEVRGNSAGGYAQRSASAKVHVRPRKHRALSPEAIEKIRAAQRKRWRVAKRKLKMLRAQAARMRAIKAAKAA